MEELATLEVIKMAFGERKRFVRAVQSLRADRDAGDRDDDEKELDF